MAIFSGIRNRFGDSLTGILAASFCLCLSAAAQEKAEEAAPQPPPTSQPSSPPQVHYIKVPLPIVGSVDTQTKRRIEQLLAQPAAAARKSTLILEFSSEAADGGAEESAGVSEFERSLALARFLASDRLTGVRTVAFVPQTLLGHAVLPVLACEAIVIAESAEFGAAGKDETHIDDTIRRGYSEIAERRLTIPTAVALAMVDRQLSVYKVTTADGTRYVLEPEWQELQKSAAVTSVETVSRAGDLAKFTGRDLRLKYAFVSHLAADRRQLANALDLPVSALQENPSLDGSWQAIRVDVRGPIHSQQISFIERNLRNRLQANEFNFLCVVIDSGGGSAVDSWRLAQFLASEEMARVRTVALVPREARGSAGLIALACDQLYVGAEAIVGGDGADQLNLRDREALLDSIRDTAETREREWSLFAAMIDPDLAVHRYSRQATGETRFFSADELAAQPDPEEWVRGESLAAEDGFRGSQLVELQIANGLATSVDELRAIFHLEGRLFKVEPNWAHLFIERLAHPGVAGLLLFIAIFALMFEFSQPGLGLPGFISAVCFILYFWSHALHGTAGWLEVLLFLAGVVSVLIEIFVVPGGFVFGIGGGLLIVTSIILASQTFVIPRNAYQLSQIPGSLGTLGVIGMSAFAAMVLIRRYLPDAPVLKRVMLAPPDEEELEELDQREATAHLHHLLGKRGRTLTPLLPSGKAIFGDDVVSVATEGQAISPGTDVVVVADRGNYLLVEPADEHLG